MRNFPPKAVRTHWHCYQASISSLTHTFVALGSHWVTAGIFKSMSHVFMSYPRGPLGSWCSFGPFLLRGTAPDDSFLGMFSDSGDNCLPRNVKQNSSLTSVLFVLQDFIHFDQIIVFASHIQLFVIRALDGKMSVNHYRIITITCSPFNFSSSSWIHVRIPGPSPLVNPLRGSTCPLLLLCLLHF